MARLQPTLSPLLALALLASCGASASPPVQLHLLPHSHCDVGWLQTVDSLSRVNVSRILDGVTGNLANDTKGRRRFIWDEMAFLQLWWDEQATAEQQEAFRGLVQAGRIEFVDNGWSQHDMGCTTSDSMISNWLEGHQWLLKVFGPSAQPKIGWSIDPFGMSSTQAVLQALMGMEAWFFTRLSGSVVDAMKKSRGLEFVWRASSSLPAKDSEIFAHVFESYYCMPLPTYAFEWGSAKGAQVPNDGNILKLAQGLANITKQRAPWFRTDNVLIPWGCDYQYQNAELVYRSTDWLIDTINAHPEWGVHAQYATPSEYLAAVRKSSAETSTAFPVKNNGSTFFPFNDWSGYFTSRPSLKGNSQKAVGRLQAAERAFALLCSPLDGACSSTWDDLETARRNNGIVQHHDAITGTGCANEEGCSGTDQVIGAHNVIDDYQRMLAESVEGSNRVLAATLAGVSGLQPATLTLDAAAIGDYLMGQGDGGEDVVLVVFNPLGQKRSEIVSLPVPVCALSVFDATTGKEIQAQVTATIGINDGTAPFYDYELHFELQDIPALGLRRVRVSPSPDAGCHGGDLKTGRAAFALHEQMHPAAAGGAWQGPSPDDVIEAAIGRQGEVSGDPDRWEAVLSATRADMMASMPTQAPPAKTVSLENDFLRVDIDLSRGLQTVLDKTTGRQYSLGHELVEYATSSNDAYGFAPKGPATQVLGGGAPNGTTLAATVARGPVMQEVRLQISQEHKTRIRLWSSSDAAVGKRIELAHRIGVLEPQTEVASRFTLHDDAAAATMTLFSEDNGYEVIPHNDSRSGKDNIAQHHWPSQMSTFLANATDAMVVAVDRSHAVASLTAGTLDVIQHRRGGPFNGNGGTVVLDDTDRIFTQTWLGVGATSAMTTQRVEMKQRLNNPLIVAGTRMTGATLPPAPAGANGLGAGLPASVHLQDVRASAQDRKTLLVRLQHLFSLGEGASSAPVDVDLKGLLKPLRALSGVPVEMTLDGMREKAGVVRARFPAEGDSNQSEEATSTTAPDQDVIKPFELRTYRCE